MRDTLRAKAAIVLLALTRALALLGCLAILFFLTILLAPWNQPLVAMAGCNGDPGAESDSLEPYMTFDVSRELPARGPNVSEASPAGLKNETGLGNTSWPLMEQYELLTLLKEALTELESEPEEKEALRECQQAVPAPEGNSEALQPTGVVKRFGNAEDTRTDTRTVEGMANTGRAVPKFVWNVFVRVLLLSVSYFLASVLLFKVCPVWAMDIKMRFRALRDHELLYTGTGRKAFLI